MSLVETRHVQHLQPSDPVWPRGAWIDAFVTRMGRLGVRAEASQMFDLATELHPFMGHLHPVEVAEAEWFEWPPHDD